MDDRTQIATQVLCALVPNYKFNDPQDQITITQFSVELADELLNQLKK